MKNKNDYRLFFANVKPFIKINYFLKRNGIASSTFSVFMRGSHEDYQISIDRLKAIYDDICKTLTNIA